MILSIIIDREKVDIYKVSSKPDSRVSNLPVAVAVAVSGHGLLQNCYLKANIFYCIIYLVNTKTVTK